MDKLDSWKAWDEKRKSIAQKYEYKRSECIEEMDKAKEEAYKWMDTTKKDWQARFKPDDYAKIAPSLEGNLQSRLEKATRNYLSKIAAIEQESRIQTDSHNSSWDPSTIIQSRGASSAGLTSPESIESPHSRANSLPYFGTIAPLNVQEQKDHSRVKVITSEGSMSARSNVSKRKESQNPATKPKRPRIEDPFISKDVALSIPRSTLPSETKLSPTRTTTFEAVSNDPIHKDTIIEHPTDSGLFYVLYCQEHQVHFTRSPAHGGGKHIHGKLHGSLDRSHDSAVKTLGYRVIDCNKELARQHNQAVDKAYNNGYTPMNLLLKRDKNRNALQPSITSAGEAGTDKNNSFHGISDPKPFHVYCGNWRGSRDTYPVMILGWDKLDEAGHSSITLAETELTHALSSPPDCYIYDHGNIIGWAPGFEDGGTNVTFRQFPVMWFDRERSWGWIPARDLREFSSYKPQGKLKKYFNEANIWIETHPPIHGQGRGDTPGTTGQDLRMDEKMILDPNPAASNFPTSNSFDGDLDRQEFQKPAEKSDNDSNNKNYLSCCSKKQDGSQTVYRKSFFDLRLRGRYNDKGQQAECAEESENPDKRKNSKSSVSLSATAGFENTSYIDKRTGEQMMRQAQKLPREASYLPKDLQGGSIDRSTLVEFHSTRQKGQPSILVTYHEVNTAESVKSTLGDKGLPNTGGTLVPEKAVLDNTIAADIALNGADGEASISAKLSSANSHHDPQQLVLSQHSISGHDNSSHDGSSNSKLENSKTPVVHPSNSTQEQHNTSDIPSGPARFEISQYTSGDVQWKVASPGDSGIQLFFSADMKSVLSSKEDAIKVKVDSTKILTFFRETEEEKNGNGIITLISKDETTPTKLVFDRVETENIGLGKKQARAFTTWLREHGIKYGCV